MQTGKSNHHGSSQHDQRKVVLVADDDDDLREVLSDLLQLETDWFVVAAKNGSEALAHLLDQQVDVAILDYRMPGLTGAEVVERARAAGVTTPIVFITAAPDFDVVAARLGLDSYLGKPFGVGQLITTVKRVLGSQD